MAFLAVATGLSAQYKPIDSLRITRGKADTVAMGVYTVVGLAPQDSRVTVNGKQVTVYKTGSFGTMVDLTIGTNPIEVVCTPSAKRADGALQRTSFDVVFDPSYQSTRSTVAPQPAPALRDEPFVANGKTLEGAFLNYGPGDDRLGGAKINFLAAGIPLRITAKNGDLYRVQLSERRWAYIPQEYVALDVEPLIGGYPALTPYCLSGSWSVSNAGVTDQVRIALDDMRPYTVFEEIDPLRLSVDLHGVVCNSNWLTQYRDLQVIKDVHLEQRESDVLRVIIDLNGPFVWGYDLSYENKALVITIKHAPKAAGKKLVLADLAIGVDAGHGGTALGAVSNACYQEKDQNIAMAYLLKEMLEKEGARVVLSRKGDEELTMTERKALFRDANVDLVLSIHCNAGGNPVTTGGTSTYYRHIYHRAIAAHILDSMLQLENVQNFGLVGNFNFSLAAPTYIPGILVETLFMSYLPDEERVVNPEYQKEMMHHVVDGLKAFINELP